MSASIEITDEVCYLSVKIRHHPHAFSYLNIDYWGPFKCLGQIF